MEELLENSRNQLVVLIRTRPTAFPGQHGLILPQERHSKLLYVPMELAGGPGILLEQRADLVGSGVCSPHHPPPKHPRQPMPQGCLVSFSQAHAQEQRHGAAEGRDEAPGALLPWVQLPTSPPVTGRASISLRTSWCADTDHRGVLWVLIN